MTRLTALIFILPILLLNSCIKVEPEEPVDTSGYNCVSGNCYSVSDNAQYSTLAACQNSCTAGGGGGGSSSGYNCVSGNCVSVSSGAQYSTLSSCQNACASPKGQLMVWTNMPQYGFPCNFNLVYVNIIGVSDLDPIYGGHYTTAPPCGSTYCVTKTLDPGTYTVRGYHYGFGSCPAYYTGYKTVTVYPNQCTKLMLP